MYLHLYASPNHECRLVARFLHANPTSAFIRSHSDIVLIKTRVPWLEASLCVLRRSVIIPLCYLLRQPNYEVSITVWWMPFILLKPQQTLNQNFFLSSYIRFRKCYLLYTILFTSIFLHSKVQLVVSYNFYKSWSTRNYLFSDNCSSLSTHSESRAESI